MAQIWYIRDVRYSVKVHPQRAVVEDGEVCLNGAGSCHVRLFKIHQEMSVAKHVQCFNFHHFYLFQGEFSGYSLFFW